MLTHSYLQISGGEGNFTWERGKRKIQFLKKTKSSGVPVFFLQARYIQPQALHVQMSKMWGVWNYSYCLWAKKHVLLVKLFLPKNGKFLRLHSQSKGIVKLFAQEQKLETSSCNSFDQHKIRQWLWLSRQCADMMVIFTEMVERWNLDYSFQNWSWPGRGKAGFLFN